VRRHHEQVLDGSSKKKCGIVDHRASMLSAREMIDVGVPPETDVSSLAFFDRSRENKAID